MLAIMKIGTWIIKESQHPHRAMSPLKSHHISFRRKRIRSKTSLRKGLSLVWGMRTIFQVWRKDQPATFLNSRQTKRSNSEYKIWRQLPYSAQIVLQHRFSRKKTSFPGWSKLGVITANEKPVTTLPSSSPKNRSTILKVLRRRGKRLPCLTQTRESSVSWIARNNSTRKRSSN